MRIIVAGMAATYPLGGVFWDYVQYLMGFHDLGHDVIYIEDTGQWCYDPPEGTMVEFGNRSAEWLSRQFDRVAPDLADRWFIRDAIGQTYGMSPNRVTAFARTADVFLNVSASSLLRDEYVANAKLLFLDSDPMYTQASVPDFLNGTASQTARSRIETMLDYDVFFTFGENINADDCLIPTGLFEWIPTRQPTATARLGTYWHAPQIRRRIMTTVGSWEPSKRPLVVDGQRYFGKSRELLRFIDLPRQSTIHLEIALAGEAPTSDLEENGWTLVSPQSVTTTAEEYMRYLATSYAEWSVAKNAYVASKSGWFSCRSACYLALGIPVILQDTGFTKFIPTGEGLIAFSTMDDAVAAIDALQSDHPHHCKAAREIAEEYFDSRRVLTKLLDDAFATKPALGRANEASGLRH
jgi:hypothetical protein